MKFLKNEIKVAKRDFLIFINKLFLAVAGKGEDDPLDLVKNFVRDHCKYIQLFNLSTSSKGFIIKDDPIYNDRIYYTNYRYVQIMIVSQTLISGKAFFSRDRVFTF